MGKCNPEVLGQLALCWKGPQGAQYGIKDSPQKEWTGKKLTLSIFSELFST